MIFHYWLIDYAYILIFKFVYLEETSLYLIQTYILIVGKKEVHSTVNVRNLFR